MQATTVRILADDLSGALETAAPLAGVGGPIQVGWTAPVWPAGAGSMAFDTDSRERDATEVLAAGLHAMVRADLAFKSIDSRLRGDTVREVAACVACGLFKSVVIAPAFPARGKRPALAARRARIEGFRVAGEALPGLAVARFTGGRWPDCRLLAGAGQPDELVQLITASSRSRSQAIA